MLQTAENREEFEMNTSHPTTQNNLITNAGFTKRRELGKQMCLTLRTKFFKPYEKKHAETWHEPLKYGVLALA